jgi:Ca2+-binding EF-hand superfamily protein
MNKCKSGFVEYDEFYDLIKAWGFNSSDQLIRELFEWLDYDKDNKITYEDLRSTAG